VEHDSCERADQTTTTMQIELQTALFCPLLYSYERDWHEPRRDTVTEALGIGLLYTPTAMVHDARHSTGFSDWIGGFALSSRSALASSPVSCTFASTHPSQRVEPNGVFARYSYVAIAVPERDRPVQTTNRRGAPRCSFPTRPAQPQPPIHHPCRA